MKTLIIMSGQLVTWVADLCLKNRDHVRAVCEHMHVFHTCSMYALNIINSAGYTRATHATCIQTYYGQFE